MRGRIYNSGELAALGVGEFARWSLEFTGMDESPVLELWEQADNAQEFIDAVLTSDELKHSQAYAELSKTQPGHLGRVMQMLGEQGARLVHTEADAASVKLKSGNIWFRVPVEEDGDVRVAILDAEPANSSMMDYVTSVHGSLVVCDYDCGDKAEPAADLEEAEYLVFTSGNTVAFSKVKL